MNRTTQGMVLVGVLALIIVAIGFLQPHHPDGGATLPNQFKELVNSSGFVNTAPFTLADLIGKKAILVDFWTYSCINCQRTFPYLNQWYAKYHDKGLEIVGVHSPEFNFEKNIDNVRTAVAKFGIKYPVVLDNDMDTWNAYQNQYWPAEYLIDLSGQIVHTHFGEGDYDVTEKAIQEALGVDMAVSTPSGVIPVDFNKIRTPELYFGNARGGANKAYLSGQWTFTDEYAQCISDCGLHLDYSARQVNLVAGAVRPAKVTVTRDGKAAGTVIISGQTLYRLIDDPSYGNHSLDFQLEPGIQVFTLTFG